MSTLPCDHPAEQLRPVVHASNALSIGNQGVLYKNTIYTWDQETYKFSNVGKLSKLDCRHPVTGGNERKPDYEPTSPRF